MKKIFKSIEKIFYLIFTFLNSIYLGFLFKMPNSNFIIKNVAGNKSKYSGEYYERVIKYLYGFYDLEYFTYNYYAFLIGFILIFYLLVKLKPYQLIVSFLRDDC